MGQSPKQTFLKRLKDGSLVGGVVGLGYVGLPQAMLFTRCGFKTIGFDTDEKKTGRLNQRKSYINYIPDSDIRKAVDGGFEATTDFSRLAEADAISICVPTPLTQHREPDLQYVENTAETIAKYLRKGQLVVLESTTYPGTTEERVLPILEKTGLKVGKDFFLAFSPEREDPNNADCSGDRIPKVVGGVTKHCLDLISNYYGRAYQSVVPVSSPRVAETSKLLENIYRAVNIALVNEMKVLTDAMDINIWEVIKAAKTKPFGFTPFQPGPGLGGHCIPIDPFYLSWKAREYGLNTRFIELAGEVNTAMPDFVVGKTASALNKRQKSVAGSKILVLGVAYKNDIDDVRESPALEIIRKLQSLGAFVSYHDPHVPAYPAGRKGELGLKSQRLTAKRLKDSDAVLILTAHSKVPYDFVGEHADLIVDSRNAMAQVAPVKAEVVLA